MQLIRNSAIKMLGFPSTGIEPFLTAQTITAPDTELRGRLALTSLRSSMAPLSSLVLK
jgi:hypothetical protein